MTVSCMYCSPACSYTWSGVLCPHSRRPAAAALSPRSRGYRSVGAWTMVVGRDGRRLGRPWPCAYSSCRTGGKHHPMCLSTDLTRAWFSSSLRAPIALCRFAQTVGSWFLGCFYFHLITSRPEIHERWPWKNSIRPSYDSMGGPGYYKTSSEATEETKWLLSQPRVVVRE